MDVLEDVLFIGYPSGLYDQVNLLPVFRRGITATPIAVDYNGKPEFLIDASVFPGSSGSPVVILDQGAISVRGGGTIIGSRFFLLGVIASVLTQTETGDLTFVDVPAQLTPRLTTTQMIDLGIVIKARTVVEAIEALLQARGAIA